MTPSPLCLHDPRHDGASGGHASSGSPAADALTDGNRVARPASPYDDTELQRRAMSVFPEQIDDADLKAHALSGSHSHTATDLGPSTELRGMATSAPTESRVPRMRKSTPLVT